MKRLLWLPTILLAAGAVVAFVSWTMPPPAAYVSNFENVMGTSLEVRLQATSEARAKQAETAMLDEIARESRILSGYDPASEFSQWLRSSTTPTKVSPEFAEILAAFDEWRVRTSGALDPAAEALTRVWQKAVTENRLPSDAELSPVVAQLRQTHWSVDRTSSTAVHLDRVPLMLNSFTKIYVVDRAAKAALRVPGITGVLLNAGGDVVVRGAWRQTVGIADAVAQADNAPPLVQLAVRDGVVATSGGYKRGFDIAGRHYSHLLDPRTGRPATTVLSATVMASDAVTAGALATAFCIMTPAESGALARTLPGVEYSLTLDGGRYVTSPGWATLVTRQRGAPVSDLVATVYAADQSPWNRYQLTITLELARAAGMGRRPYVAVWVEDKDHFPVRTIALWFDGNSRYLPELRAWYRADRLRATADGSQLTNSVSSPTRVAGKYTLQWDGKDDAGKPVAAGAYTVCIEAAREHGTYQVIRQEMEFSGAPKQLALPGGTEISGAQLDYHQVGGR